MAERILVVEDESIVAMDIKSNLLKLGYEVCGMCITGEDAIEKAQQLQPSLVLMDIRLKGEIDGIQAADEIRKSVQVPIIYLTAHADDATVERAKITEPFGYILKPFQPVELRVAIELALHKFSLEKDQETAPHSADTSEFPRLSEEQAESTLSILDGLSLPAKIDRGNLLEMVKFSSCKSFPPGEHIVFEGDERRMGFLVLRGRLSLLKTSLTGRELIVEILLPGDLFGVALALEDQPYSFSARAQLETEVLLVPRRALISMLENEPSLYRAFVELIAGRLTRAHSLSRALAHDKVEIRLASGLLAMLPAGGDSDEPPASIRVTRKELSEMSGTTVETAIRVTKAMERDGLLDLTQNGVVTVLDPNALVELTEGV